MSKRWFSTFLGFCGMIALTLPVCAQSAPVQRKPPMYTYVADWQIPRAHWSEVSQALAADKPIMDKALTDGTLIGYGDDLTLVHSADGETHDDWWSSMSMAGLLKVLNQLYASGNTSSPAIDAATKHWDLVFVSHYYNWHPGTYKSAYTYVANYELKADAPDNAVDTISQNIVVPVLEKMLADGTLIEYEIDELSVHTQAPGTFSIVYLTSNPNGIDKIEAAIRDAVKGQPLIIPAFDSMTKGSGHRDELLMSEGTYK